MKFLGSLILLLGLFITPSIAQIKGPTKIDAHKPIILESVTDADVYIWKIDAPAQKIPINDNKVLHVWAPPKKSAYNVTLTTITVDWDNKKLSYNEYYSTFEVIGNEPGPDPNPGPDPTPEPTAFKQKVEDALKKVKSEYTSYKENVGKVYQLVASEAKSSPNAWDPASMINEAKVRLATELPTQVIIGWMGFWPELAQALKDLKLTADDLDGHIKAFEDIATVLN